MHFCFLLIHHSISSVMHTLMKKNIKNDRSCWSRSALHPEWARVKGALKYSTQKQVHLLAMETDGTLQPENLSKKALVPSLGTLNRSHHHFIDN